MAIVGVTPLGQVGYRLGYAGQVIYIDPYLSHYVAEVEGQLMGRLFPVPFPPEQVKDADWVLITHGHIDHCDPKTLGPLANASPQAKFLCPGVVASKLLEFDIAPERISIVPEGCWFDLSPSIKATAVPAAHPGIQRDSQGGAECVGFVLELGGKRIYHAGDTSPHYDLIAALKALAPLDVAFLPVNERNFFRDRVGIIGNMSVREAFLLADELGVKKVVPTHWDMFKPNSVSRAEIELLYRQLTPRFELSFYPETL